MAHQLHAHVAGLPAATVTALVSSTPSTAAPAPRVLYSESLELMAEALPCATLIISDCWGSTKPKGERTKTSFVAPVDVAPPTTKTMEPLGAGTTAWPVRGDGARRFVPAGCDHVLSTRSKIHTSPRRLAPSCPPMSTRQDPLRPAQLER